ncbi:MAG TPA: cytochrome c oxidase subunit II [Solirubrobacteraceae bacterium]|jgi:cytochrome c oxidase subunit 2|nr:cytochrome c oxidase subunit II [Solirubrobacteraceae bacterium]
MSSSQAAEPHGGGGEPNHAVRFAVLWVVVTVIALPVVIFVIGPLLGPGNGSEQSGAQGTDYTVLATVATPVLTLVVLYLLYAVTFFRQPKGAALEGPAIRGDARVQTTWIIITSLLVLGLAAFGTVRLETNYGSGSGSGPSPLTVPKGPKLPVQVIAQQWLFTYRYPTYGGVETRQLYLPKGEMVELHVTSIDVIHSFWAYKLGVKADANPGVDNVAFVRPTKLMSFGVRCAELCGVWHGYMYNNENRVVTPAAFLAWIHAQQKRLAPATKVLPPYAKTYIPEPSRRGE